MYGVTVLACPFRPSRSEASRGRPNSSRRQGRRAGTHLGRAARGALRRRRARHDRAPRGDRLAGHHRRRAAQAELLRRTRSHGLETSRPTASRFLSRTGTCGSCRVSPRGPFRYRTLRRVLPRGGAALRTPSTEAGGDLGLGAEPSLSRGRASPATRGRSSSTTSSGEAEADIRRCLERGAHSVQIDFTGGAGSRSSSIPRAASARLRRPQQPRPRTVRARGAPADRRAHLPGRRPGLDPQRRRRLRGAAAERCSISRPGSFYIQLASEPDRRRVLRKHQGARRARSADLRRR